MDHDDKKDLDAVIELTTKLATAVATLGERVLELEDRLQEAGRRALFHADNAEKHAGGDRAEVFLADVGRALLFDPETPNKEETL